MALKKLSEAERQFAGDNYSLIARFLKKSRFDEKEFFDIVVLDYLEAVQKYLNNEGLQARCTFEQVSFMYMKRAVYRHFREQKTQKRSTKNGNDVSFEDMEPFIETYNSFDNTECKETISEILKVLTPEQRRIFIGKLKGYGLKEIAEINAVNQSRVYRQFRKIKCIVADIMET